MNKRSFNFYVILVLLFLVFYGITGCNVPGAEVSNSNNSKKEQLDLTVKNMDNLSCTFSKCIDSYPEILPIIYQEIGKKLDGDTETLYSSIKDFELQNGKTIEEALCSLENGLGDKIKQISKYINLQIYMPDYDNWNGTEIPLIGFVDISRDDNNYQITAYDSSGKKYYIDESNYKDKPCFLFGPNERMNSTDKKNSGAMKSVDTRADVNTEKLYGISISNTHEPWYKGNPEIYITSPGGNLDLPDVNEKNTWYNIDKYIFIWRSSQANIEVWESDGIPILDPSDNLGKITVNSDSPKARYKTDVGDAELEVGPESTDSVISAPYLISPAGTVYILPVEFQWGWPSNSTGCIIKVGCKNVFSIWDEKTVIRKNNESLGTCLFSFSEEIDDYFMAGNKMWWSAQAYNDEGNGPESIRMEFSYNSSFSVYNLTVKNSELQASSVNHGDLTSSSVVEITAPLYLPEGSPNPEKQFSYWQKTGTADIDNINSNTTNVRNFGSDVTVTAMYSNIIIIIPDYTLTVNYYDHTDTYTVKPSDAITIYAPETISIPDPNKILRFNHWDITGAANIDDINSYSTAVRNFGSNVAVTAVYQEETINFAYYTLTIHYLDWTQTINVNTASVITIDTPSEIIKMYDPILKYTFYQWSIDGSASIADVNSNCTTVSNFSSNVHVWAHYDLEYVNSL